MRLVLVIAVASLVFAASATAAAPTGFYEAFKLEPAASFVAGKAAPVFCASDYTAWLDAKQQQGFTTPVVAFTDYRVGISVEPDTCGFLRRTRAGTISGTVRARAVAIETLVHESIHWRTGSHDEGTVDCAAMYEMPRVAVKFFHVTAGKQLRALMAAAWADHRGKAAAYQTVC